MFCCNLLQIVDRIFFHCFGIIIIIISFLQPYNCVQKMIIVE